MSFQVQEFVYSIFAEGKLCSVEYDSIFGDDVKNEFIPCE
ncbi:hypothetical protein NLO413_0110 [Candidatus Neoehrlichia lotoris str. RAC413]|uniref:Uncharacterized protein n=1 Tax=Candidatus Neoehrlichia procyonis str. RAC413 TaxID=1359163 RepID=A0A0F3NM18_9RICK|nr:hypothetical protein NLO413_0110 [Candidatus Neoehrlichia lotoris str. RAC413]